MDKTLIEIIKEELKRADVSSYILDYVAENIAERTECYFIWNEINRNNRESSDLEEKGLGLIEPVS